MDRLKKKMSELCSSRQPCILGIPQIRPRTQKKRLSVTAFNCRPHDSIRVSDDVNTSGVWEPVRSVASNANILANISLQAHLGSWMGNIKDAVETVRDAVFETQTLAANERKYKNISIDLIKYRVIRSKDGVRVRGPKSYFYITKGMRPDCVYYCWMRGINTGYFFLDYHVCDIVMPQISSTALKI